MAGPHRTCITLHDSVILCHSRVSAYTFNIMNRLMNTFLVFSEPIKKQEIHRPKILKLKKVVTGLNN